MRPLHPQAESNSPFSCEQVTRTTWFKGEGQRTAIDPLSAAYDVMKSGTWTKLWGQCIECAAMKRYLQYAAEQGSNLIRSFWYGKFLQTVPNDALLSCKATQALVQPVDNQRKSVSHAPGPNKQPHLMDVQRALKSMQSCESALSPTVYDLVVKSVVQTDSMEQFPPSVLRRDCTLEWSEVAKFLGNGSTHKHTPCVCT